MTDQKKWCCEYCTYENYAASKKCTLCYASRPRQYITEPGLSSSQDIYQMASLMQKPATNVSQPSTSTISQQKQSNASPQQKWECLMCTYLNWPKALRCTQCQHERHKPLPCSEDKTIKNEQDSCCTPLSISVTTAGASGGCSPNSPNQTTQSTSPRTIDAVAKVGNNLMNRTVSAVSNMSSVVSAAVRGKWICPACTYENWPKATKCVLCTTNRGQQARDNTPPLYHAEASSHNKRQQCNRSPESPDGASAAVSTHNPISHLPLIHATPPRNLAKQKIDLDLWLNACRGVIDGNLRSVETYLIRGGDPSRQISQEEALLLNRSSAFQPGYTLIHLGIRFKREEILKLLCRARDMVSPKAKKIVPAHVSPNTATDILRHIAASLRQRKGDFPCFFTNDLATFSLPADIVDLPHNVQKQLFDELLDNDVQHELEVVEAAINWNMEICDRYGSRLHALWNRTCGDCLLDSALQATWGVFDRDNVLRRAVADSLAECMTLFYPRWKETESAQVNLLHFTLEESQWQQDWATILSLASQPGASLEQIHIFALAHVLRRPIIVYGIKYVKNTSGENLSLARFQGVYLPLLWEIDFCWRSPICLGYTRGHFSALVPIETEVEDNIGAGAASDINEGEEDSIAYMPLTDCQGKLLPVHFLVGSELGREESLLKEWMDCWWTDTGILMAQMRLHQRPTLVKLMMNEWIHRYTQIAHGRQGNNRHQQKNNQQNKNTTNARLSPTSRISEHLSSDEGETDDE